MLDIKTDSRKIKKGDTFIALKGIESDGHDYILKAIENGASKVVVMNNEEYSIDTIKVDNTRKYLEEYLINNYSKYIDQMNIIAFTGTNGKTTSAYLLYNALNKLGKSCAYIGTIGYYTNDSKVSSLANTTPDLCDLYELIIDAYEKGHRYLCLEASSQGIAYKRVKTLKFNYCVFSNLTQDHLDYHKTMENYANAKKEIFYQLKEDGVSIINADDSYADFFKTDKCILYGKNNCDIKYSSEIFTPTNTEFDLIIKDNIYKVNSPLIGKHNIYNLISVISVLYDMKFDINDILNIIPTLSCPPGRMDIIKYKTNSIIVDYAHTADAFENIISAVKETSPDNIYIVFGCTGSRDRLKRPIMTNIALSSSTKSIITIDDPHDEDPEDIVKDMLNGVTLNNYKVNLSRKDAIKDGIELLNKNDVLLILGKGHEDFIIFGKERIPFNDKQTILELIKVIEK